MRRHPFEDRLGYEFADPNLLERALTHRSIASDHNHKKSPLSDNEQLEFLGDAILGFVVSEALLARQPDVGEGQLSKLKSRLVSAAHLHEIAIRLGLGDHLILGRGEELSGGRSKKALLADAIEALIAALYVDGGIEPARRFVLAQVVGDRGTPGGGTERDYSDSKSALQELAQSMRLPQPRYYVLQETGPDHRKTFTVEVRVGKDYTATGEGASKKIASQHAASALLARLSEAGETTNVRHKGETQAR
jgi:ribonuclease-3